jgi:uncharacterized membrane-anchored protein YjiN (DUF445 family)
MFPTFDSSAPTPDRLARMKAVALGLLLCAAVTYGAATLLEPRHPAWGYLAAAAEAAMVGALADWFAVVALFRHPLGLRIPHTAIIASNKNRLGEQLALFLDQHFLTPHHLQQALASWDMAGELGRWLSEPASARRVGVWLQQATPALAGALDQPQAHQWMARLAKRLLREADLATLGGQALGALTEHGHHQQWLNGLLLQLSDWAGQESMQERLTDAIARELTELKYLKLDQVAARLATRKLVAALTRTLSEVAADPEHELRQRFDSTVAGSIQRLQNDADWQARVARWRDAWLEQPQWQQPLEAWWRELLETLRREAQNPQGVLVDRLAHTVQRLGQQLQVDEALRDALNRQGRSGLLQVLDRNRATIVSFVAQRVQAWDAQEMSNTLEQNIGRDLQFIRINGTLVGALVGLLLHALTEAARALPLVQGWMSP